MKYKKIILLLLTIWIVIPKYGTAVDLPKNKDFFIVKEISATNNFALSISVSDFDLEDDDDDDFVKKNIFQFVNNTYCLFGAFIFNTLQQKSLLRLHSSVFKYCISTFLLLNNFRI